MVGKLPSTQSPPRGDRSLKRPLFDSPEDGCLKIQRTDVRCDGFGQDMGTNIDYNSGGNPQSIVLDPSFEVEDSRKKSEATSGIEMVLISSNQIVLIDMSQGIDKKRTDGVSLEYHDKANHSAMDDEENAESHRTQSFDHFDADTNVST